MIMNDLVQGAVMAELIPGIDMQILDPCEVLLREAGRARLQLVPHPG